MNLRLSPISTPQQPPRGSACILRMQQLEDMIVGNLAGKSWALKKSDMAMGKEHGTPLQKKGDIWGEHGKIMGIFGETLQFMGIQSNIWEKIYKWRFEREHHIYICDMFHSYILDCER